MEEEIFLEVVMVYLKTPLVELEIMKKFVQEYIRYAMKCPPGMLRTMQQLWPTAGRNIMSLRFR